MAAGNAAEGAVLAAAGDRYIELVRACPLRPIRSEAELDRAIAMLNRLMDLGGERERTAEELDYMDVLGNLVERYEDVHWPMPADREGS